MEITRVSIILSERDRVKAYATITLDDCFMIHGLEVIRRKTRYLIRMPRVRRPDGQYVELALPLNNKTRQMIHKKVVAEYKKVAAESLKPHR